MSRPQIIQRVVDNLAPTSSAKVNVIAFGRRVRHLPARTRNNIDWKIYSARMTAWRIKNVDIPYWKKTHLK